MCACHAAKVWVFETAPLAARPQPLPSQRFSNSWPFKGGRGIFIAARYDNAPLINNKTFYNELVYVPGRYQPCKSSPDAYFSVARILVDDLHAQAAGRAVWGYPKEMARFNWTTSGTSTLLRVTQRGKLIFAANFTDAPSREPYLPPWLLSADQRTMQVSPSPADEVSPSPADEVSPSPADEVSPSPADEVRRSAGAACWPAGVG
ncbi:hypothetical protein OEZ86_005048 [Tetradesmus obliquus]|nr:hypothetical protein OEZ86_005048 [Tetradesmus obliquus]